MLYFVLYRKVFLSIFKIIPEILRYFVSPVEGFISRGLLDWVTRYVKPFPCKLRPPHMQFLGQTDGKTDKQTDMQTDKSADSGVHPHFDTWLGL